ncbi:4a-hydroxytetrahydrobiopterin dehydratase [soil metagenome]
MTQPLNERDLGDALARLEGWRHDESSLLKEFRFDSFVEAFAFLTKVALLAERQDHHPEIHNVYGRVALRLRTHDADDAVSERDVALAEAIEAL